MAVLLRTEMIVGALLCIWCACSCTKYEMRSERVRIETDVYIVDREAPSQDYSEDMLYLPISEAGDSLFGGVTDPAFINKYRHPDEMVLHVSPSQDVTLLFYFLFDRAGSVQAKFAARVVVKPVENLETVSVSMKDVFEVAGRKALYFLVVREEVVEVRYHTFWL